MKKSGYFIFLILLLITECLNPLFSAKPVQEITQDDYLIRNGKIWRNLYLGIRGNPYFLTGEFMSGDISFNGKVFTGRTGSELQKVNRRALFHCFNIMMV